MHTILSLDCCCYTGWSAAEVDIEDIKNIKLGPECLYFIPMYQKLVVKLWPGKVDGSLKTEGLVFKLLTTRPF